MYEIFAYTGLAIGWGKMGTNASSKFVPPVIGQMEDLNFENLFFN